jgi:hypothetical protein
MERLPAVSTGRVGTAGQSTRTVQDGDTFSARLRVDSSSTGPSRQPSPASVARSSTQLVRLIALKETCSANRLVFSFSRSAGITYLLPNHRRKLYFRHGLSTIHVIILPLLPPRHHGTTRTAPQTPRSQPPARLPITTSWPSHR